MIFCIGLAARDFWMLYMITDRELITLFIWVDNVVDLRESLLVARICS